MACILRIDIVQQCNKMYIIIYRNVVEIGRQRQRLLSDPGKV